VNFWTLTCINWLRQEPYIRAWSQAYRNDGLIVIGVHTPEFSFERDIARVRQATKDRAIDYPVAVDMECDSGSVTAGFTDSAVRCGSIARRPAWSSSGRRARSATALASASAGSSPVLRSALAPTRPSSADNEHRRAVC